MSAADNAGHVEIVRVRGKGRLDPHFCWEGPNPAHDVLPLPFVCKECGFCAETRDVLDSLTFWWASTTAEPAAQAESAAPVVRLRCQGCGHFENELESVRWCKVYGDAGHSLIPVDQRGVAIVSPAPDTAHLDRLSRLYSATPTPGAAHTNALGNATSCENAERHIARLSEYLGEANDEVDRLRMVVEAKAGAVRIALDEADALRAVIRAHGCTAGCAEALQTKASAVPAADSSGPDEAAFRAGYWAGYAEGADLDKSGDVEAAVAAWLKGGAT